MLLHEGFARLHASIRIDVAELWTVQPIGCNCSGKV